MSSMITIAVAGFAHGVRMDMESKSDQKKARRTNETAEEYAIRLENERYEQSREDWAPWRDAGTNALANTQDPDAFETSPGYQFRVDEGNRNTENLFSVKGGGGNAMRALNDYNQNMASNEYGNWFNRQLATAGLGTTGNVYSQQSGQNMSNNNAANKWRSTENGIGLGLYGAREQASYQSDALGSLLGGLNSYANRQQSNGGSRPDGFSKDKWGY
jgi:hypothetical protein